MILNSEREGEGEIIHMFRHVENRSDDVLSVPERLGMFSYIKQSLSLRSTLTVTGGGGGGGGGAGAGRT